MAVVQEFTWTDDKVKLLLKMVKIFKVKKESTGIGWGPVKSKYEDRRIFSVFFIGMQEVPSISDSSFQFPSNIGEIYWYKQYATDLNFPS